MHFNEVFFPDVSMVFRLVCGDLLIVYQATAIFYEVVTKHLDSVFTNTGRNGCILSLV